MENNTNINFPFLLSISTHFGVLLNCVSHLGNVYFHDVYILVVYLDFVFKKDTTTLATFNN